MTNKIAGWLLLFLGVAVISFGLYSSYNIFTAKTEAPEIFSVARSELDLGSSQDLEAQTEEMIREYIQEMIPADSLPQLFNLISWSLLAGILIFGGAQIAGLGVKLLKE